MLSGCKQAYTHVHSSLTEAHSITMFQDMYMTVYVDTACGTVYVDTACGMFTIMTAGTLSCRIELHAPL